MNKYKIVFQIGFVLLVSLILESICWLILYNQKQTVGFLINLKWQSKIYSTKNSSLNDQIDPLCGWAISEQKMKELGFEVEQNCVVLRSKSEYPAEPLKIFITGGLYKRFGF